jgi:2-polyprenyl-6-hydroxyphenyl methylase/3-demethylubiquinone-9 3-methyltransferase
VHSFDHDPQSVACVAELRRRYSPGDKEWVVEQGSVLDRNYLRQLGEFDVVYSWGVLHHTGRMWDALENVIPLVRRDGGVMHIAIYNDQGVKSARWSTIKQTYSRFPLLRPFLVVMAVPIVWGRGAVRVLLHPGKASQVFRKPSRGMSRWHDLRDWVGGYPFEVAKPEEIFDFYRARGFRLERLKTCGGGLGCNEYVFVRDS